MPLVDYASSDEGSENESEVGQKKEVVENGKNQLYSKCTKVGDTVKTDRNEELFSSLPKPIKNFSFFEDDTKLSKLLLNKDSLPLGRKESVKIYVPSITEFEKDIESPPKKIKSSVKGAGLFSILPPPKNISVKSTNLMPQAVSKNQFKRKISSAEKFIKNVYKTAVKETGADEEDDDDTTVGSSFFGSGLVERNDGVEREYRNSGNILTDETPTNVVSEHFSLNEINAFESNSNLGLSGNGDEDGHNYTNEHSPTPETLSASDNPLELDEKALQILCGNKKKRQQMPMNIIDLSSKEVLPDSKEWLLKQFTEEKRGRSHSHKKNQGPSSQSRRKHQITYLAYQAKEQELELQNQWANNRMSRKQTQSKYGF